MLISLLVPRTAWSGFTPDGGDQQLWLLADDESWAKRDTDGVAQSGPRRIWDEVSHAYQMWDRLGRPTRECFGVTVTDECQWLWLANPDNEIANLSPAPG